MKPDSEQEQEQQAVAKEITVDLDSVRQKIIDSQEDVSELLMPILGWALLTFLILDMAGNVLGIPVLTGSIICREVPSQGLIVFAFLLQIVGFAVAGLLLYRSRWRFWWRTMFATAQMDAQGGAARALFGDKFQSLFTKVTEEGRKLRDQAQGRPPVPEEDGLGNGAPPQEPGSDGQAEAAGGKAGRKGVGKILLAVALLAGAGALIYFYPGVIGSAIMLVLIAAGVFYLGDAAVAMSGVLWDKIRRHYGSMMGLYAGGAAAVVWMLLFGTGSLTLYPIQAWLKGQYFPFRVLELFLLGALILVIKAQQKVSFKYFTFYRATKPQAAVPRTYHVFDFVKVAAWPAYLSFDPDQLTKIVVLGRRPDRHYEVIDHSLRLALMNQEYTVLNLQALQVKIGPAPTDISDSGDFFRGQARYVIMARSFEALHSSMMATLRNVLPERPMTVFLEDLFKHDNPRLLLDRILKKAVDQYVGERGQTAVDLRERYADVLGRVRESAFLRPDQLRPDAALASGEAGGLSLSVLGYEQLRATREALHGMIEEPRNQWQFYRQKRLKAKQELPGVFEGLLQQHFVETIGKEAQSGEESRLVQEAVDCLLKCSGIELEVDAFELASDAARQCESMVGTIDKEFTSKCDQIELQLREREAKLLDVFEQRMLKLEGDKRAVVAMLIKAAPEVLPFLLQNPVGERFVRFLLSLGESAVREKLEQLRGVKADANDLETKIVGMMDSAAPGSNPGENEQATSPGSAPRF